jgi:hypothetical protein
MHYWTNNLDNFNIIALGSQYIATPDQHRTSPDEFQINF